MPLDQNHCQRLPRSLRRGLEGCREPALRSIDTPSEDTVRLSYYSKGWGKWENHRSASQAAGLPPGFDSRTLQPFDGENLGTDCTIRSGRT